MTCFVCLQALIANLAFAGTQFYTWYGERVRVDDSPSVVAAELRAADAETGERLGKRIGMPLLAEMRRAGRTLVVLDASSLDPAAREAARQRLAGAPGFAGFLVAPDEHRLIDRFVLVRFAEALGRDEVERLGATLGYTVDRDLAYAPGAYRLETATVEQAISVANALVESGRAAYAEPDRWARPQLYAPVVNDDYFPLQWHLGAGVSGGIDAADAWDTTQGSQSIVIAVVDTGVEMTHPEFQAGKLVSPLDAWDNDTDPTPSDGMLDAHGTSCAGLVAAPLNAGGASLGGIVGVCPNCSIMPVRLGPGDGLWPLSTLIAVFNHVRSNGAHVMSNSWGFGFTYIPQAVYEAMEAAIADGVIILFASGNSGAAMPRRDLAAHPNVIAVGGVSPASEHVSYSSFGPALDIVAPTMEIDNFCPVGPGMHTTDDLGARGFNPDFDSIMMAMCGISCSMTTDYTCLFSGTSAACPVAAGAAGLLLSQAPTLTPMQVRWVLTRSADKVGSIPYTNGFNEQMGYGRVDMLAALALVTDPALCVPSAEVCSDGVDNDCDDLVDADDLECGAVFPPALDLSSFGNNCTPDPHTSIGPSRDPASCGSDLLCWPFASGLGPPAVGICSLVCVDACPAGYVCAGYTDSTSGDFALCLQACTSPADCSGGDLCVQVPGVQGPAFACAEACSSSADCPQLITCTTSLGACGASGPGPDDGGPIADGGSGGDTAGGDPNRGAGDPAPLWRYKPSATGGCACAAGPGIELSAVALAIVLRRWRRRLSGRRR